MDAPQNQFEAEVGRFESRDCDKMVVAQMVELSHMTFPAPAPKNQKEDGTAFLPAPSMRESLLRAGNQPRQDESIPPDKLFRPAESALIVWILLEIVSNFVQQTPH